MDIFYSLRTEMQEKQLELMEDRIRTLEQNLIIPAKYYWQVKKQQTDFADIPEIFLSKELEKQLFEKNYDYLLDLRFLKFPSTTTIVLENYYRESAKMYWPLRFVLYSSGSNFVTNDMLPRGIANRIELGSVFLQKSQSFNFAKDYDHLTVLTLSTIGSVLFHSDKKESMLIYTKMAIEMAIMLGINTEEGIAKITPFDYEREQIRRIWWLIYANFVQIPNSFGVQTIPHDFQKIFLPSDNPLFESASANDYYGIEIMSNTEWYTALIHNQSIQGYRILLHRMQLQIHRYNQIELTGELKETPYIAGSINASLKDWYTIFLPKLNFHLFNLKNGVAVKKDEAWLAVYLAIVYSCNRVNLILASFMKNIIKGRNVTQQLYFKEAVEAVLTHGKILQLIIQINPNFQQISTFTLFPCAFFLLCCRKIPEVYSTDIELAYQLHLEGFKLFSRAFQKVGRLYTILQSMESMPIVEAIIFFGIFKKRNMDETVEVQAPNHIDQMCNLSIKKCDRNHPCSLCTMKNLECVYSQEVEQEKSLTIIANRIKALEQNLIVPTNNNWISSRNGRHDFPQIPEIYLSKELERELFEKPHDYLLDLRFQKFPSATTMISEEYYRESCKIYWPLRYALYSSGSNFLTDDMLPSGLADRLELANVFLQKSQSFAFAHNYDHLTVLTLSSIGAALFHLDQKNSMLIYIKMAILMAKMLNLNTEQGIASITPFDYERENIRRIWWLMYSNFVQVPNSFGFETIIDTDHGIFLPSENTLFESATCDDYYGIELMSNIEWYTAKISGQSVQGYRIILHRIQLQIQRYIQIDLTKGFKKAAYIAGTINASLNDWYEEFSPLLNVQLFNLANGIGIEMDMPWLCVYLAFIYNSNRINLILPRFMKNIIKGRNVTQQLYFWEAMIAGLNNAKILQLIIQINPKFEHFTSLENGRDMQSSDRDGLFDTSGGS
ncbi:hypothetical protein HDV06_005195 [Boothiomyces sp. JEL0866]|nr:hypothetical protein HDV06_005195 [Boothiomyces sp. JEL0866]